MNRRSALFLLGVCLATPLLAETQQVLSSVYSIEKKYKSMEGPAGAQTVYLGDRSKPELLWLVAIRTEVVGADGTTLKSPELMCHMNIDIDPMRHKALFNLQRLPASRLMTISQGMRVPGGGFEARLPDGFAFPVASNEPLFVMTQVLNHNIEHPHHLQVRHRVTFEYVRDSDVKAPLIPLFNVPVSGMVQMADNPLAIATGLSSDSGASGHDHNGTSCLIGMRAPNAAGMNSDYVDPQGRHMTGHWVVPPGKQVNASDVTWFMSLPYDTKLHYAAVHLHPFAQSLTLRDTTTGTDLFKARAKNPDRRVGLDRVDSFFSRDGVPMYKSHKYELVSVYNNPTKSNADSMASMFLAVSDPEFVAPTSADLKARAVILSDAAAVILRTSVGDVGALLMRQQVPATVLRFARLIHAGAFRSVQGSVSESSIRFSTALTEELQKVITDDTRERGADVRPGSIALCTTPTQVAIVIATRQDSTIDPGCTVVAQIGPGGDVVRAMSESGKAELVGGEILAGGELNDLHLAPAKHIASR